MRPHLRRCSRGRRPRSEVNDLGYPLLRDPATNQDVTVPTADIQATAASPVSPMPAAFDTLLLEPDFFALITYLRSPP